MSDIESVSPEALDLPAGLTPEAESHLREWLTAPAYADLREETRSLVDAGRDDPAALARLEDAFCRELPIGTGGRRGEVGAGPNRINSVVLTQTALPADAARSPVERALDAILGGLGKLLGF